MRSSTLEALEGFAARLDGKPAHKACPHYTSSPAGMAGLVGAWLQKAGRPAPRPRLVFSEGEVAMSDHAYRLPLMKRALGPNDAGWIRARQDRERLLPEVVCQQTLR